MTTPREDSIAATPDRALVWRKCVCGAWYWGTAQTDDDRAFSALGAEAETPLSAAYDAPGSDAHRTVIDLASPEAAERLARAIERQNLYHGRYGTTPAGKATAAAILAAWRETGR